MANNHARAETGEPYMINIDTCNDALPKEQKDLGLRNKTKQLMFRDNFTYKRRKNSSMLFV